MIRPRPAGFWIRALAAIVDFAVFFVVYFSLKVVGARVSGVDRESSDALKPLAFFFTLVFAGAYTSVLHCLAGQTIGKMLVGVRVVAGEDEPPLFGTALLRFVAYFASAGTFTLGFVMAGLRQDKRALHDLIAGTRVERSRQPEAAPPPTESPGPVAAGAV
ncbi:MAG: hypothetical protein DMD87_08025 [Candidatus Rokuibacteriota bacterium]|nr:MAG: hypothetical protein DMD87_08025 [Candidatus Rokubacteria bacterium]